MFHRALRSSDGGRMPTAKYSAIRADRPHGSRSGRQLARGWLRYALAGDPTTHADGPDASRRACLDGHRLGPDSPIAHREQLATVRWHRHSSLGCRSFLVGSQDAIAGGRPIRKARRLVGIRRARQNARSSGSGRPRRWSAESAFGVRRTTGDRAAGCGTGMKASGGLLSNTYGHVRPIARLPHCCPLSQVPGS